MLRQKIGRLTRKILEIFREKELLKHHLHFFLGFYYFIRPNQGLIKKVGI